MCFCIFTLVFTYIVSELHRESPPHLGWCCDGEWCLAQGRSPLLHYASILLSFQNSCSIPSTPRLRKTHFTAKCSLSLQVILKTVFTFLYIKTNQKKVKNNILFDNLSSFQWSKRKNSHQQERILQVTVQKCDPGDST